MQVHIELWQLLSIFSALLLAFLAFAVKAGQLLLKQAEERLDQRFATQEEARAAAQAHWDRKFEELSEAARANTGQYKQLERDLLELKAALPVQYVRREDYIRNQTIIEAKLDGVRDGIENLKLRGAKHD